MGYYQGDFYKGARGDPGFFSFLGGIAKKAVGFIPGVGPAVSSALSVIPKVGGSMVKRASSAIIKHPVLSAAGAAGALGAAGMATAEHLMAGPSGRVRGFHMSKPHRGASPHMVRNRHMNVCNPRALRRAVRRAHGFAKLAMRTIHLVHPKKKAKFGGFKKKRSK